jgi:RNase H-fold protein (predicted Holliday junction resolvase)
MHIEDNHRRWLAFDVRPQRLGYAIFMGPHTLLDWGVKNFRGGINAVRLPFSQKVAQLISGWQPDMVILNEPRSTFAANRVRTVQAQAQSFHIPVLLMSRHAVREVFRDQRNKDDRARVLAARFSELTLRLPPKRKPWKSEDYRLSIFDAVTVGVTYYEQSERC